MPPAKSAQREEGGATGEDYAKEIEARQESFISPEFRLIGSHADFTNEMPESGSADQAFSVPVSWYKLHYSAGKKKILRGLTGTALPSRCLAIMGSSGAGKTTFLNAICDRTATNAKLRLSGTRQLGDIEYERHYRKAMGFVTQDDIISALSTPSNSLRFSLRARRGTALDETHERVRDTMDELRLLHCKDTVVGVPGLVAGLSGGERKRCNIGVELICDPKVLLLDEPTSGLDSVTSAKVTHLLAELARKGRTIIYTIHQPTAEVLSYFDDLMLLTQGKCVYHGTMAKSVAYFESIGYKCPSTFTPSDFFMTLLQDSDTSKILIMRWKRFIKHGKRTPHTTAVRLCPTPTESETKKYLDNYIERFSSTWWIQFTELLKRNFQELLRDHMFIGTNIVQSLVYALIIGLIFVHLQDNMAGMQDRSGLLFMNVLNAGFRANFMMINTFPKIRAVYLREQQAGAYSPLVYFVTKRLVDLPLQVLCLLFETLVIYWMTGLYANAGAFFIYYVALVFVGQIGTGIGFTVSTLTGSTIIAAAVVLPVLLPLFICGGLLASTSRLRPYWYWLEKPSFFRQGFIILLKNELDHITHISCDNYALGDATCFTQPKTGYEVLAMEGFTGPQSAIWIMWTSLAILFGLMQILGVLALTIVARQKVA